MIQLLKIYFSFYQIKFYYLLLFVSCWLAYQNNFLFESYEFILLPIILLPFVEWFFHKYILHFPIPKKPMWLKEGVKRIHYSHHQNPNDLQLVVDPIIFTLPSLLIVPFEIYWLFGFSAACMVWVSSLIVYLFYEWTHLMFHTDVAPLTAYGQKMKKAHLWHHFHNENYWWGITSHLADLVFGSYKDPKLIERSLTVRDLSGGPIKDYSA